MIAHVGTLGVACVVAQLVANDNAEVVETFGALFVPVFVARVGVVERTQRAVTVAIRHVGRHCPYVGVVGTKVGAGLLVVGVYAVEADGGREPRGQVEAALVAEVKPVGAVVDHTLIVALVVDGDVVACLVGAAAQGEIVLLHHLSAIHIVGIFFGKVVVFQCLECGVELFAGDLSGGELIVAVSYG